MKKTIIRRVVAEQDFLASDDLHPMLKKIYCARGVRDTRELELTFSHLLPFQDLLGIEKAAQLLADALHEKKRIVIIGDFDSDGATSTALAMRALKAFGCMDVHYIIPNRFEYGYGLTPEIVTVAKQLNPDVLVTVDSGIASHAGVAAAIEAGMQVIITDHHLPATNGIPPAHAIVNPQQPGDTFVSKNLAGVGVIFYVMLALRHELRSRGWFAKQNVIEPNMAQFLDLVALGTVADLVALDHNNRILVQQGISRIKAGKSSVGIYALFQIAGRSAEKMVAADLGFSIAPRLNAAGRLTDMKLGVECLITEDANRAYELATQLSLLNEERRQIEHSMQQQAQQELQKVSQYDLSNSKLPFGICLFDESWHQGVIGLIASRLKDKVHRPVIVFAPDNDAAYLKGSARSVPGLHIRDALDAVAAREPTLISKFGGHAMAAGLTLPKKNFTAFSKAFDEEVRSHLSLDDLKGILFSDGDLAIQDISLDFAKQIKTSGPWGQAFPEPLFDGRFRILQQMIVGSRHLKLTLMPEFSSQSIQAIAFNINNEEWPNHRVEYVHAAYRLDINEYMGRSTVQLIVEQLEPVLG